MRRAATFRIEPLASDGAIFDQLAELHRVCFTDSAQVPWSAAAIGTLLATPGTFGFVAITAAPTPAGLVIARALAGEGEVLSVCVSPGLRRRGVATALLDALTRSPTPVRRWLLEVAVSNEPARALYARLGFQEVGRRPRYYRRHGQATDALIFERICDQ